MICVDYMICMGFDCIVYIMQMYVLVVLCA